MRGNGMRDALKIGELFAVRAPHDNAELSWISLCELRKV